MKILFMATTEFSLPSLQRLAHSQHQLVGVVTQPDRPAGRGYRLTAPPVKHLSERLNLPIWQPGSLKGKEGLDLINSLNLDLIVVAAFGQILPQEVLAAPRLGVINVHPSLLPKYRGAAPVNWPIIMGDQTTGLTIIWLAEGIDNGDIILQQELRINPDDTAGSLSERLSFLGAELLMTCIRMIEDGTAPRQPQDNSLATYAPRLKREDGLINWQEPAVKIHNLVRGLNPDIGAYTYLNGQRLKVWQTQIVEKQGLPGVIIEVIKHLGIVVGSGQNSLLLTEVQLENKKRISGKEYIIGQRIETGARFSSYEIRKFN